MILKNSATLNRVRSIFLLLLSLVLLFTSILLRDPVLLKIRYTGLIGINLIGISWLALNYNNYKKIKLLQAFILLFVLASMGISLAKETSFQYKKSFVRSFDKDKLSYYATHILIGFRNKEELKELLELPVIGFFVTQHNVKNLDLKETQNLIATIQQERRVLGFSNALIATDQEGGKVSRLSPPLKKQSSLGELLEEDKEFERSKIKEKIESFSNEQAEELKKIGVNVNFSPIVDLKFEKEPNAFDFYSRIYNRAISKDPSLVSFVAEVYSKKLLEHKILPTLKHFPGLGRVAEDTHFFNASLDTPLSELEKSDLIPFEHIAHNVDYPFIMLSHSTVSELDSKAPISISEKGIQGYIRPRFPVSTVLITDDMNMGPMIYFPGGIGNAALTGINAGIDILLVSYDGEQIYEVLYSIIKADQNSKLNRVRLEESKKRLHRLSHFLLESP